MAAVRHAPAPRHAPIPVAPTEVDAFILQGGLDEITPTLQLKPGVARQAANYEAVLTGGYARIGGYERYDGRARPSSATYTLVQVVSFTNTPTVGQTLTGFTSGATGQIVALGADSLVLTLVTGSFTTAEVVKVGATIIGTATPTTVTATALQNAQWLALAADAYRALIGTVPGSGAIRGVFSANFGGVHQVFAFRDNIGATACVLYKATTSGWTAVTVYNEVSFTTGGATAPAEGATLTQGGNTALIKRVVWESGSWGANTAAGRLIVATPAPGNYAAGAATIGAINVTLLGVQTAIVFAPAGKFEFDYGNFSGQLSTTRIYGADGVNRAFEFDGTILAPIATGATVDTPKHIKIHQKALVVSIGSSLMISGPGVPYHFNSTDGGAEIATGDTVTGLMVLPGVQGSGALGVDARNATFVLYGTAASGSNPWNLTPFNTGVGGLDYSQQVLIDGYKLDDRGVTSLKAAQEFGNFLTASLTFHLQTFITSKRGLLTCSAVHRTKSQYRLFFSDGSGLWLTLVNGKPRGAMPIAYANAVNVVWNAETASGEEVTYAGSLSGGYVYELDRGSSFDGEDLPASLTLALQFLKSPRVYKRYRRASLEIASSFYAAVQFGYVLGYGGSEVSQPTPQTYSTNLSATPLWDAIVWDAFTWDGMTLSPTEVELDGTAEGIQYTLSSTTDYIYPYTINSLITHYTPRRAIR